MVKVNRRLAFASAVVATALVLGGCSASSSSSNGSVDASTATSAADFGGIDNLIAAAEAEGTLNVIALPRDWANYGAVIDAFTAKYPGITVNEQSPDDSSAQEIQAATANDGLDTAPDVFDLGTAVTLANTDMFAPYKVQTWDDIPDNMKESTGLYVADYGGYMSVGYDSSKYPAPTSLSDLLSSTYKGAVALNGDPTQAGAAFAAVGLATVQNGGTLDNFQAGIDFFQQLKQAGNFLNVSVTSATIASGETPVVFDWDYLNAANSKSNANWKTVLLPNTAYAGYYNQAINANAPHPAAARLWEEFLYSDEAQNLWLAGGARPIRAAAMEAAGTLDLTLWNALPAVPATIVVPTSDQATAAATLLGQKWAAAVN